MTLIDTLQRPLEYANPQTKVTYTGVKNVVFVTRSTLGHPRAVLCLEQGLAFLLCFNFVGGCADSCSAVKLFRAPLTSNDCFVTMRYFSNNMPYHV